MLTIRWHDLAIRSQSSTSSLAAGIVAGSFALRSSPRRQEVGATSDPSIWSKSRRVFEFFVAGEVVAAAVKWVILPGFPHVMPFLGVQSTSQMMVWIIEYSACCYSGFPWPRRGWCYGMFLFFSSISVRWSLTQILLYQELVRFVSPSSIWPELGLSSSSPCFCFSEAAIFPVCNHGACWSTSTTSWPLLLQALKFQQGWDGGTKVAISFAHGTPSKASMDAEGEQCWFLQGLDGNFYACKSCFCKGWFYLICDHWPFWKKKNS